MGSTTFTDSSSGAHTITANGDVVNVAPKIGTGMGAFDGSGDYLTVPASSDFDFSTTGQFTIEFWCNIDVVTGHQALIHSPNYYVAGNNGNWAIDMYQGDVRMNLYNGTGSVGSVDCSGAHISAGQWHHVAVDRDSGGTTRIFVDGTLRSPASTSFNGQDIEDGKNGVEVGGNISYAGPGDLNGYMDDLRISRTARYTANFTAPTTALKDDIDTVLLMHMDGGGGIDPETNLPTLPGQGTYFWDASNNAIFYDSEGLPTNKSLIDFDGSGDYLEMAASNDWNFGTGDFTIETWAYFNSLPDQMNTLWLSGNDAAPSPYNEQFAIWHWGALPKIGVLTNAGGWTGSSQTTTVTTGVWHHIAWSRASGIMRIFLNGVLEFQFTSPENIQYTIAQIGRGYYLGVKWINAYLDQFRVSDTARYTAAGTNTFTLTENVSANILIVAGGGGGSGGRNDSRGGGSGGGGGGLLEGSSISLNAGTYTVTVGGGGAGGDAANPGNGTAGANSVITEGTWGTATALGGGQGS